MDQLMNTKEVAAYLGIHEKKVYYPGNRQMDLSKEPH